MLVHPKNIYKNCYGKYAIPAINVFTMEQIYALFRSGQNANAPFIVQITPVAREYASSKILISINCPSEFSIAIAAIAKFV